MSQLGRRGDPSSINPSTKDEVDEASMSSMLLAPLKQLQGLAHTLFLSLSPPQTKPPPPPPLSAFLECDQALASAINLAHIHQIKQRKIDALEAEILALESEWRKICKELAQGKSELEEFIEEGEVRIKAIEQAKKGWLVFVIGYRSSSQLLCTQHLSHILNFWPTLKASVHLRLHHLICLIWPSLGNPHPLCFFRLFPMKRKCAVDDSTQKHRWVYWEKYIRLVDVSIIYSVRCSFN
jgi:Vitamin-D-receptor interacting Mediator subunit 4